MVTLEEKTCTRATLEFDSREVPGYPRFTLCSLKWGHDLPNEFQGESCTYIYIYLYTCTARKPPNYSPGWLDDVLHLNWTIYFGAHDVVNGKPYLNHPPGQTYVDAFEIYLLQYLTF